MERVLQKLASQLVSYDEASLMALWDKYAALVVAFEPTRRWEEAVLIFGCIQSVRMKNQLFNRNLAACAQPDGLSLQSGFSFGPQVPETGEPKRTAGTRRGKGDSPGNGARKRCKVLRFHRRKDA